MNVAYLTNAYPHVRHTFIRREIVALEGHGLTIHRFSIRRSGEDLVDPADRAEFEKTRTILDVGLVGLVCAVLGSLFRRPWRTMRALLTATRLGWCSHRGLARHWIYLAEACVLRGWLAECQAEHLHVHFATNPALVALLCEILGGPPYSITIHGPEEWDRPEALALREKYERARFVVAVSHFGKCQVMRWLGYEHWHKVHVVHCGVDAGFLKEPLTPVPEARRLVLVGGLVEQKGHLVLIQALGQLRARGETFEMVLVGDGPLRHAIEKEIENLGLDGMVRITGWMSNADVREELKRSRALVMSSLAENLPVAMMEAMATGRPVIGTYVAGVPELVQPGKTGWLVPASSVEDLAEAMREVLHMPTEELTRMSTAARDRVALLHDVEHEAGKLATLFHEAIGTQSPHPT